MTFPKQREFIFPNANGRIKTPGGDQELRTSSLVRHRPIQGDGHVDFLGESEGSLPQPQEFPDAGEAINDFWSMSGNFIYRHHVEPKQEKRIDDDWNIDGSRDLSDPWTGFTQFALLEEKLPDGKMWSGGD